MVSNFLDVRIDGTLGIAIFDFIDQQMWIG